MRPIIKYVGISSLLPFGSIMQRVCLRRLQRCMSFYFYQTQCQHSNCTKEPSKHFDHCTIKILSLRTVMLELLPVFLTLLWELCLFWLVEHTS
ncbi:hypothetical protein BC832DRAFT_564801 [Gaertneriomyces semiglobifer]|nr:hypothetical protein BC832DRAFT_564801 [Gaertneriomyces semiglobifer]